MGAPGMTKVLGCGCAAILVLAGCAREGGRAATNAPANAVNLAAMTNAPPNNPPANTSQNDLFPIDNAADNATNSVDPAEAGTLAAKNADCVDQLIKSQPFGETRNEIIDNVTRACLPIAQWEAQASPKPPPNVAASERKFVVGRVEELDDDTNAAASNSAQPDAKPPPPT
jgi:hypothetical protein